MEVWDWIAEITPLVHDVSSFAGSWWNQLMEHVGQVYKRWLASDALTRLTVEIEALTLQGWRVGWHLCSLLRFHRKLTAGELKSLQSPAPATNAPDAIEKLLAWHRNVTRAGELGVTLPDPVLQVHLDAVVKGKRRCRFASKHGDISKGWTGSPLKAS